MALSPSQSTCAVCVFCGGRKTAFDALCVACDRTPVSAKDIAKSLLLSSDFQWDAMDLPKSDDELRRIGECIASGRQDCVPAEDIEAMVKHLSELDVYSRRWSLPMVLLFWFTPAMLLVVFVVYLIVQVMGA